MKECSICKKIKKLDEFYKNQAKSFGVDHRCIVCFKEYQTSRKKEIHEVKMKYKRKNKVKYSELDKRYREGKKQKLIDLENEVKQLKEENEQLKLELKKYQRIIS